MEKTFVGDAIKNYYNEVLSGLMQKYKLSNMEANNMIYETEFQEVLYKNYKEVSAFPVMFWVSEINKKYNQGKKVI